MSAPQDIVELERALTRIAHLLTRSRQHDRTVLEAGVAIDRASAPLLRVLADAWAHKYDGDWAFEVDDGAFVGEGGRAHVFAVAPDKVLAFAKGDFAQTRFRF